MADLADLAQDSIFRESEDVAFRARLPVVAPRSSSECKRCGDRIEARRLRALPSSSWCVDCAELMELQSKQFRR